jgi:hypothetical protein
MPLIDPFERRVGCAGVSETYRWNLRGSSLGVSEIEQPQDPIRGPCRQSIARHARLELGRGDPLAPSYAAKNSPTSRGEPAARSWMSKV